MRVVLVPRPHLHAAAVVASLAGGPRYEGPRECGLTHFLEHMLFRGTKRHPVPRDLMAAFETAGLSPEAETGDDEISLLGTMLQGSFEKGVGLLADVLQRPAFADIERERKIILEERLDYVNEDGEPIDQDDLSRRLVFQGHPLGRPVLGEESDIRRYRRAHLERHRERLVRRGNLVVGLAGPVGESEKRLVEKLFADVPEGERPASPSFEGMRGPKTDFVRSVGAPQCDVRFTFVGPGEDDPRAPALRVLAQVLDGGPTARLPLELVDEGWCYSAQAGLALFADVSLLEVDLAVSRERLSSTVERTLRVLRGLVRGIESKEVERAHARLARRRELSRDDALDEALWHVRSALLGRDMDRDADTARVLGVGAKDVHALAKELLVPANLAFVVVGDPSRKELASARRLVRR